MFNLAGLHSEIASEQSRVELSQAGIQPVRLDSIPNSEVRSNIIGNIYFPGEGVNACFHRAWYYWVVRLEKALPHSLALKLNKTWGSEVRVDGFAGGKEPNKEGVFFYHVDTQAGLDALKATLIDAFGRPEHIEPGYSIPGTSWTAMPEATPADAVEALCELAKVAPDDQREWFLLNALNETESRMLNSQMLTVTKLLKQHYKQARARSRTKRRITTSKTSRNEQLWILMDNEDASTKLSIITGRLKGSQRTRRSKIKQLLLEEIASLHTKEECSNTNHGAQSQLTLLLLWLARIENLLGQKREGAKDLAQARTLTEVMENIDRQTLRRLPECAAWNRFQGSISSRLLRASAYCYPG